MELPSLSLPVGILLNLQILGHRSGHRIQAKVLGYKPGESLIAEVPGARLLPIDLRLGDELAVRCLVGRRIIGFMCTVYCAFAPALTRIFISPFHNGWSKRRFVRASARQ